MEDPLQLFAEKRIATTFAREDKPRPLKVRNAAMSSAQGEEAGWRAFAWVTKGGVEPSTRSFLSRLVTGLNVASVLRNVEADLVPIDACIVEVFDVLHGTLIGGSVNGVLFLTSWPRGTAHVNPTGAVKGSQGTSSTWWLRTGWWAFDPLESTAPKLAL